MLKRILLLALITVSIVSAKVNVGFYSLSQSSGNPNGQWMGYALMDIITDKFSGIEGINIVRDDDIYAFLKQNGTPFVNTGNIASFDTVKEHFKLDFIVTGSYTLNPDQSLPVNILVHSFQDTTTSSPIVIQGYSNDLFTIVSYVVMPIGKNLKMELNPTQVAKLKTIDLTSNKGNLSNVYKGKMAMRQNQPQIAMSFFEAAYKENPESTLAKKQFTEALGASYGTGFFAFNLMEAEGGNVSGFRKQFLLSNKIIQGFSAFVKGSNLIPKNGATYFDIELNIGIDLSDYAYQMAKTTIQNFSSGTSEIDDGVYNPNAGNMTNETEMFVKNISAAKIVVTLLDNKGNAILASERSFGTAFNLTNIVTVKDFVKNTNRQATIYFPSIAREVVKNIDKVEVTVK
ncbi:MAG: hypothetical protein JXR69_03825 [Candidatus Delongbacteria bacterium]|nr:hypothetical protein [Candidatus Delongbacteria bacterium]